MSKIYSLVEILLVTERAGNKTRKKKVAISPLFAEHADTEQLAYNLSALKEIKLKSLLKCMEHLKEQDIYLCLKDKHYWIEFSVVKELLSMIGVMYQALAARFRRLFWWILWF